MLGISVVFDRDFAGRISVLRAETRIELDFDVLFEYHPLWVSVTI